MVKNLLALLVVASFSIGCVEQEIEPGPKVTLLGDVNNDVLFASLTWASMGFRFQQDDGSPDCPRYWYQDGVIDCTIRIEVRMEDNLAINYKVYGMASQDKRLVWIDTLMYREQDPFNLKWLAAHEVGHILIDAGHHEEGVDGVMQPGWGYIINDNDWALACESIGRCK